ncbi:MAG: hypothetical protein F6K21_36585 [Symploca sp. SIO2D2]|nr:hypothetical protein [Symploca sp. SIO2D2]
MRGHTPEPPAVSYAELCLTALKKHQQLITSMISTADLPPYVLVGHNL